MSTPRSSSTAGATEGSGISERPQGELIAVALTDRMGDGLSMVYSFFNPDA